MAAVPKKKLSEAEYLVVERRAEYKSEFYRGEMFAMAGAKYEHNRAKDNLAIALGAKLLGGSCFALTSDMRVKVPASHLYTYPDIVVVCGRPEFEDDVNDTLLNPLIIIEVLSDSTEKYDRGAKFRLYQPLSSLREYVLVAQDKPVCERFVRQSDDSWLLTYVVGLEAEFAFATVPVSIPLATIYSGITFPDEVPR